MWETKIDSVLGRAKLARQSTLRDYKQSMKAIRDTEFHFYYKSLSVELNYRYYTRRNYKDKVSPLKDRTTWQILKWHGDQ